MSHSTLDVRELLVDKSSPMGRIILGPGYRRFKPVPIGETGWALSVQHSAWHLCDAYHKSGPLPPPQQCQTFEFAILEPSGSVTERGDVLDFVANIVGHFDATIWAYVPHQTVSLVLSALHNYLSVRSQNANT